MVERDKVKRDGVKRRLLCLSNTLDLVTPHLVTPHHVP